MSPLPGSRNLKASDGPAVTSVVVAAGEVGSGTAGAAGGQHFSKLTPRGIAGYPDRCVSFCVCTVRHENARRAYT